MKSLIDFNSEKGSAIIELLGFGIFLQIPILVFAVNLGITGHQQLALESIARHGVRSFTLSPDVGAVSEVVEQLTSGFGISSSDIQWSLNCMPEPDCTNPKGIVSMRVNLRDLTAVASLRFVQK